MEVGSGGAADKLVNGQTLTRREKATATVQRTQNYPETHRLWERFLISCHLVHKIICCLDENGPLHYSREKRTLL